MPKLKKKDSQDTEAENEIDVEGAFAVEDAKDEDFELNLDSARFKGQKGQAGDRTQ